MSYAAFYADCQHEVRPVRSGFRLCLTYNGTVELGKSFAKLCQQHGWASFEAELTTVIETMTAATVTRNAELLQTLCVGRDKNAERLELCRRLSERSVQALAAFDQRPRNRDWQWQRIDRAALLGSLVTAMTAVGTEQPPSHLLDHALACDRYDLTDAHLAAIFALESRLAKLPGRDTAVTRWLAACRRELGNRTAEAPQEPTDYRRADKLSCKCADCRELSAFLADPNRPQARFPLAKARRQHLHGIIDSNRCDYTHVTEHRGRPHTLVCTKTTASYEAAGKIYERTCPGSPRWSARGPKWPFAVFGERSAKVPRRRARRRSPDLAKRPTAGLPDSRRPIRCRWEVLVFVANRRLLQVFFVSRFSSTKPNAMCSAGILF